MMKKIHVVIGCAIASFAPIVFAADRLVPAQYATIQAAIDASVNGDVVQISPGTYQGPIDLRGKSITVRGLASDASAVVVSGGQSVVRCVSGESSATIVEFLTITGGTAAPEYSVTQDVWQVPIVTMKGAGIRIVGSSPTIRQCRILSNAISVSVPVPPEWNGNAIGLGAGVYVNGGAPQILGCLIAANSILAIDNVGGGAGSASSSGGGIYLEDTTALVVDCLVTGNTIESRGSPVSVSGAGICTVGLGRPSIRGCSIISNTSTNTAGCGGSNGCGMSLFAATDVVNCRVSENQPGCSSATAGVQFFAIGSTMSGSRICGNSGTQTSGAYVNLGGNSITSTCPQCAGDLNGDSFVDGADLGILLSRWGPCVN